MRRRRQARLLPVLALVAAIVVVIVVLASSGGSGGGGKAKPSAASTKKSKSNGAQPSTKPAARVVKHHRTPVPILMYHVVGDPGPGQPNVSLFTRESEFRAQIAWLRDHGYHAVTLQQAYDFWKSGVALPAKPIVISFDDGYLGQFTHAFPVMQALHWPGVLNLKVGNIGKTGIEKSEVKQMVAAGWEIDAHTITHPDLTTVGASQLRTEVFGSKSRLKALFGVPVNFFCYPAGRYNATVVAAVKAAGYLGATTTTPGFASPKQGFYTLDRVRIDRGDGAGGLATKLASRGAGISGGGE